MPELYVYPNPAVDRFFIELTGIENATELQLSLYDLVGQEVFRKNEMAVFNGEPYPVDIPKSIAPGLYFILARNEEYRFVKRVVIGK